MEKVSLNVNGVRRQFIVEPDHILLGFLKKDLHLIGAKWEESMVAFTDHKPLRDPIGIGWLVLSWEWIRAPHGLGSRVWTLEA